MKIVKKFFKFLKVLLIILFVLVVIVGAVIVVNTLPERPKEFLWSDIVLSDMVPEIKDPEGFINYNTDMEFDIDITNFEESKLGSYIVNCKNLYPIDVEYDSNSFTGYNEDGYKLHIYYLSSELSIELTQPVDYATINWPLSEAGMLLPIPKSNIGRIENEDADGFRIYVSEMTKDDYADYVIECQEAGFDVDYDKDDTSYSAKHDDGFELYLSYEGFNVVYIRIDRIEEKENIETTTKPTEADTDGIRPEFQEAMDSYEEFMGKYVEFMKKYAESDGSDLSLMADYMLFISDYEEAMEEFDKWDEDEMSDEEMKYYIEVQARVLKKLDEIS